MDIRNNKFLYIDPSLGDYYELQQRAYKRFKEHKIEQKCIYGSYGNYYLKEDVDKYLNSLNQKNDNNKE